MPIIRSAKKKLRKDLKREIHNNKKRNSLKGLLKDARRNPSKDSLSKVFSALDRAAKTNLIHTNKASRLKSRLSKSLSTNA